MSVNLKILNSPRISQPLFDISIIKMNNKRTPFLLDPNNIDPAMARAARKRLQADCQLSFNIQSHGETNLRKKCRQLFTKSNYCGFTIDKKNLYAMIVSFDEQQNKFRGCYIARVNGQLSVYRSNLRFSLHSIERLIMRLKMKDPRLEVAKAIHSRTKYVFTPHRCMGINIEQKWRTPGLNDVDTAVPYLNESGDLLGMFFETSTSNIKCTHALSGVVKTFVSAKQLRAEQYAGCMEVYEAQKNAFKAENERIYFSDEQVLFG